MLRDGLYKMAKDLQENESLMPLHTKYPHKVKAVRFISQTADVYDLTIENNHNFALDSGVFVHNSKDSADALCGSIWNASQHADEYDFEFGETLDALIEAEEATPMDPNQQQVLVSFEEELKKSVQSFHEDAFTHLGVGTPMSNNYDNMLIYDGIII